MNDKETQMTAKEEIPSYEEIVFSLAENKENKRFSNGKPDHAAILLRAMLTHASEKVRIFTGKLYEVVYNEKISEEVNEFLSSGKKELCILIEQDLDEKELKHHPLIKSVRESNLKNLYLRKAVGTYASGRASHFSVMDKKGFRFELEDPIKSGDKTQCRAIANFNEPSTAKQFADAFDGAFSKAKEVQLI